MERLLDARSQGIFQDTQRWNPQVVLRESNCIILSMVSVYLSTPSSSYSIPMRSQLPLGPLPQLRRQPVILAILARLARNPDRLVVLPAHHVIAHTRPQLAA